MPQRKLRASGGPAPQPQERRDEGRRGHDDEERRTQQQESRGDQHRRDPGIDHDRLSRAEGLHGDERGQQRDREQVGDPRRARRSSTFGGTR